MSIIANQETWKSIFSPIQRSRVLKNKENRGLKRIAMPKPANYWMQEDFSQVEVQSAWKACLKEGMCFGRSTFSSEVHEHHKQILESLINENEINQIKKRIFSQFKNKL